MTKHIDLKESKSNKKGNTPVSSPAGKAEVSNDSLIQTTPEEVKKKGTSKKEQEEEFVQVPHVPERHRTTMKDGKKSSVPSSPQQSASKSDKKAVGFKSSK